MGSLLVRVSDGLGDVDGGTSPKLMLAEVTRLLPITGTFTLIPGTGPTLMGAVIVVIPGEVTVTFAEP